MKTEAANVKRIIVEREDGTSEVITRGLIADYSEIPDADEGEVKFDLCGLTGHDIGMIVMTMLELGARLGMFGNTEQKEDDAE